jgi:ABC-type Fe3+ transport system permease subunit
MCGWPYVLLAAFLLLSAAPVVAPLVELAGTPEGWQAWDELPRLAELALNSGQLAAGTLVIVLPLGIVAGAFLFRTGLPGRHFLRFIAFLALFVPLPLVTAAWQMALGGLWYGSGATPLWPQGLAPAIAIHSLVALPWVIVLTGLGLSWVEPELEEDALTTAPAWRVLVAVSLPRAAPAILLAALWTALTTLNEITTVTDTLVVRTLGEEVYYQFTAGSAADGARAVAVSLPAIALLAVTCWLVLSRWRTTVPPRLAWVGTSRLFSLGAWSWPLSVIVAVSVLVLVGVPLGGLLWKAGLRYGTAAEPAAPTWDIVLLLQRFVLAGARQLDVLANSAILALATGVAVALLAGFLAWLSRDSRLVERLVWLLAAGLWAMPGPVLAIGLLNVIQGLLDIDPTGAVRFVLWERPSPIPNMWLCVLRFLPVGLAALWPLVRLFPSHLDEAAILDGATPWQRFTRVYLPAHRGPLLWTGLGVAVLTLGELSGSKLISTPQFKPLAQHVFEQMHYGADPELAALCLVLLAFVTLAGVFLALATPRLGRSEIGEHESGGSETRR